MNTRTILIILGAVAAVPLIKMLYDRRQASDLTPARGAESSPKVKKMVEKTLHQHEGEDTTLVHAFEAALEEESRHDQDLAHSSGLRA